MIQEVSNGYVKVETHNGITTIEFFHPKSNSLPAAILADLAKGINSAANDEASKVIVLRSVGENAFCAGASFDELISIKNEKQGQEFFMGFANVINALRKCPKFTIGRIQGNCVGGGVGLAASLDYCIAWEKVEIKLRELSIGIGPFVVGPAVERKIGNSAFTQLAIDSDLWRNSDWAKRKGLFAEVHPSIEDMDESIRRLADALARYNPEAMKEMKKIMWKGTEDWDLLLKERAAISGRLVLSEYTKSAILKFKSMVSTKVTTKTSNLV